MVVSISAGAASFVGEVEYLSGHEMSHGNERTRAMAQGLRLRNVCAVPGLRLEGTAARLSQHLRAVGAGSLTTTSVDRHHSAAHGRTVS